MAKSHFTHNRIAWILAVVLPFTVGFSSWQSNRGALNPGTQSVLSATVSSTNPQETILATEHEVFLQPKDRLPIKLWQTGHLNHRIRKVLSFPETPDSLFVLTSHGCVLIDVPNRKAETVFESSFAREVLSFAIVPGDPDHWLAGTSQGLFESDNRGKSWYSFHHLPSRDSYSALLFTSSYFFAGGSRGLYRSPDLIHFSKIYSRKKEASIEEETDLHEEDFEEAEGSSSFFVDITSNAQPGCGTLWLSDRNIILQSVDCGSSWKNLPLSGMRGSQIQRLVYLPQPASLFASDDQGVYRFLPEAGRWEELYHGLSDTFARDLFALDTGTLAAVTEDGLMRLHVAPFHSPEAITPSAENAELLKRLIHLEPSARAVQQAVIRYSNTGNGKINRWHAASRLSALMPKISFGRDESISDNIDLDRGSTSDPDVYIAGPQDLSRGWDFDVSWDLSNFIFGTAQTSIDSRQKLTVDQRQDLLSEATRIYYERRRLQTEILLMPSGDPALEIEKRMRLDELTSLLDAMTDGFMSAALKKIYANHPEFFALWEMDWSSAGIEENQTVINSNSLLAIQP